MSTNTSPYERLPWDDDDTFTEALPDERETPAEAITNNVDAKGEATGVASSVRPLVALNLDDFLNAPTVPREFVLDPILPRQGVAMIHAKRGVGKTYCALAISVAVASGSPLLKWHAPEARRVLYIDGEMPASLMQERLHSLVDGLPRRIDPENFRIINADLFDGFPPNLSTREGQKAVESHIEWADLIVIDNLATLSRHGKENETESWHPMQEWLLSLRRRRKSVLLVHHSNKGGAQRGTSSREDILDTVISLNHPADYEPSQGARFIVAFEKTRGRLGGEADPFEASMEVLDGAARWTVRSIEDTLASEVAELKGAGKSYREIGSVLGISKSAAERAFRRHLETGTG